MNKGYDVNTNDLVDVTDEFKNKMTYGSNQSVNLDFGDITSAYVVMVNTKFQYTNSESPTLPKWLLYLQQVINPFLLAML